MRTQTLFLFVLMLYGAVGTAFSQKKNSQIQHYLSEHKTELGLSDADIDDWIIYDSHTAEEQGITYMYLRQKHNGYEVYNAVATFAIKGEQVIMSGDQFLRNIAGLAGDMGMTITAKEAIGHAANQLGMESWGAIELIEQKKRDNTSIFRCPEISLEDIPTRLMLFETEGELRMVWDLSIYEHSKEHWWSVRVDAVTGVILDKVDWVVSCEFDGCNQQLAHRNHSPTAQQSNAHESMLLLAPPPSTDQYNVFALPTESPNHGGRTLVVGPSDATASPYGWHDDNGVAGNEYTDARGNNVRASEDANDNNDFGYSPSGGASLNFDFPLNLNQAPSNYQDPAITNLFYMNNIMHDVWYHYGFDEASGNFQEHNYGNGGQASDRVNAEAQDGGGTNNANFATPGDGQNPRMQMYVWTGTSNLLTINSPAALAGAYSATEANFGAPVPMVTPITEDIVIYDDGSAAPTEACNAAINAAALNGNIAIVRRGNCNFVDKVANAETAGAVAVIVVNNVPGAPITMGGTDPGIGIPSVMVSQTDGEALILEIESGGTVNGTLLDGIVYDKDGDFDNGIIAHEYGHGISNRLTGGASNSNCLSNAEQMGEGWSDWFGIMLTIEPGDTETDNRGVGTYVTGESTTGVGIRPAPYNTDFNVNGYTYAATNNTGSISQPHGIGFVWATMLWDLTWALVDVYGMDYDLYGGTGGNNIAMHLVMNGLKLQPCSPGFVDGRDAILQADQLLYNGANQCLIWNVFANRGLGYSADQGDEDSRTDQVEAFDLPPGMVNSAGSESATACQSYTWGTNGTTYTTSGAYVTTIPNAVGCDSTVTLNLTINNTSTGSESATSCANYVWATDGNTYTSSGAYTAILTNAIGCDSTVTLNLTINPTYSETESVTACTAYTWPADGNTYGTTGTYSAMLTSVSGCDSLVTLDLTMSTSAATSQNVSACSSYSWAADGNTYTGSGTYSTTLMSTTGCDSIVTLNLTVNNPSAGAESVTTCDSYTWAGNGQTYSSSGAYTTTLTNVNGCDSVATLNLTINTSSTNPVQTVTSCDSYTWSADGNTYTTGGTYYASLTNATGCDSNVVLDLTVTTSSSGFEDVTVCDSYTWGANGQTYSSSGSYTTTLTNAQGCDSTATLNLTINTISSSINYLNSISLNAAPSGATYQWLDCSNNNAPIAGATSQSYAPATNGIYACVVNLNGCVDTTDCRAISELGIIDNDFGSAMKVYPNPTSGQLMIELGEMYEEVSTRLTDINGKLISVDEFTAISSFDLTLDGAPGYYLLEISTLSGLQARVRIMKE